MDRFKFRVWDKRLNRYLGRNDPTQMLLENGNLAYLDDEGMKFYEVESCTGLKDKNGELIYENDLIKCPSGIYRIAVDDFGLWTAIYNNNPFEEVGEWSDMVKEYAFNQDNIELEVLGNIHENADLLGEKE